LRTQIDEVWHQAESCQEFQKGDTIQGRKHCLAVEHNLGLLIPDEMKAHALSQTELFVLSAAACLHDVGKVETPDHLSWKSDHGLRSREIINEHYDELGLDRAQAAAVGYIVGVHGSGRLEELPRGALLIGTDEVHLIPLSAVFRLADMLDTSYQRAPELVARIKYPDGKVPDKWRARQAISGWTLDESHRIILQAIPNSDELQVAYALKDMMTEDLAKIAPHLRLDGYPCEIAKLDVSAIRLEPALREHSVRVRPFPGMAFYEENQANIFRGREAETDKLISIISNSPITLLIGESGAGKTSLIHAGLFPRLKAMLWRCVWTRPLRHPQESIKELVWRHLLEGPLRSDESLWAVMKQGAERCVPHHLLVVMDQFEDVLNCAQEQLDALTVDLIAVQSRTVIPNLRVLISFREDSYVKLNTRLLKRITGSAQQFPSVELEHLTRDGAEKALLAGLENAHIGLDPRQETGQRRLLEIILDDIQKAEDRVYPPYLQMVAETLCRMVDEKNPIITRELYFEQAKGADNIIAHYLLNHLKEFSPQQEKAKKVLVYLTTSAGKKAQRTLTELSRATEIATKELQEILVKMVDLRMVRPVDEEFEIIHDHLGKVVDSELVNEQDRTIKFLQEQLDSFQRLYEVHRAPMSSQSFVASLYRNRKKIAPDEQKHSLLLCTSLSIGEAHYGGCCWYWLRQIPRARLLDLTIELFTHSDEEIGRAAGWLFVELAEPPDLDRIVPLLKDGNKSVRETAVMVLGKIGSRDDLVRIASMLKDENESIRYAAVKALGKIGSRDDLNRIVSLLKDGNESVLEAAAGAFANLVTRDDLDHITPLLKDGNKSVRETAVMALRKIGSRDDLVLIASMLKDENESVRYAAVEALGKIGNREALDRIASMLKDEHWSVRLAAVLALGEIGTRDDLDRIASMLNDEDRRVRHLALDSLVQLATLEDADCLLDQFADGVRGWNDIAQTHFEALCKLDSKFYCPVRKIAGQT
jgi:HEAT repeat protein